MSGMRPSVLIADDHAAFRHSARRLLELDGLDVVAEAEDGASALTLARELAPDVVLLDVYLPDANGFDIAEQLRSEQPGCAIVFISSHAPEDFGSRIARSGACGFVSKDLLSGSAVVALLDRRR